jgi:hypothetical protein
VAMSPKEKRFARQVFLAGLCVYVLSWFGVVSRIAGRLGLIIGICGGSIARGIDTPPHQAPEQTHDRESNSAPPLG